MRTSPLVLAVLAFAEVACGGGLAPASLNGKTVEASETAATGNQVPVGDSSLLFTSETAGKIDGLDFTYGYTPSGDTATIKATLPGSDGFTIDYDLTFIAANKGTFAGKVVTGGTGTDSGNFVIR